jgi:hypothetical protein
MNTRGIVACTAALALSAAGVAIAPAAQAKTITACVKKSDGSVKFLNKKNKKCKKGWVKRSWNTTGPQGPQGSQGPAGPAWLVKDKNGVTLGTFAGYYSTGLVPEVSVTTEEGAVFQYKMDGTLVSDNENLHFLNNGCTDAVVFRPTKPDLVPYLQAAGGNGRAVFQVTGAPTVSAWRVAAQTTTDVPVGAGMLFKKDTGTGTCAAAGNAAGFYVPLTPAAAPVVPAPGPLQIVR